MFTLLLFFIIGQTLNLGIYYWIIWGLSILFWAICFVCKMLKLIIDVKEEQ